MKILIKMGSISLGRLFVSIIILGVVFLIVGCKSDSTEKEKGVPPTIKEVIELSKSQTPTQPQKSPFDALLEKASYQIHASTLTKEYEANEFAADDKYKGQIVLVQSQIEDFTKIGDSAYVKVKPFSSKESSDIFSISCQMQPSQRPLLAKLKKGEEVYVIGKVHGVELFDIELEECLISRVPTKE